MIKSGQAQLKFGQFLFIPFGLQEKWQIRNLKVINIVGKYCKVKNKRPLRFTDYFMTATSEVRQFLSLSVEFSFGFRG